MGPKLRHFIEYEHAYDAYQEALHDYAQGRLRDRATVESLLSQMIVAANTLTDDMSQLLCEVHGYAPFGTGYHIIHSLRKWINNILTGAAKNREPVRRQLLEIIRLYVLVEALYDDHCF